MTPSSTTPEAVGEMATLLRDLSERVSPCSTGVPMEAAADMLQSLSAQLVEATAALEPFAREADRWTHHTPDETPLVAEVIQGEGWEYRFTLGDLRSAAALANTGDGK